MVIQTTVTTISGLVQFIHFIDHRTIQIQRMVRGWLVRRRVHRIRMSILDKKRRLLPRLQAVCRRFIACRCDVRARLLCELRHLRSDTRGMHRDTFTCPITLRVPDEPVYCSVDRCIYEQRAIMRWLETHDSSPMSRLYVDTMEDLHRLRGVPPYRPHRP
jgi:hypothetical protein